MSRNERIARFAGWTAFPNPYCEESLHWTPPQSPGARKPKTSSVVPDFSKDNCPHWQAVYRKVEERGLLFQYADALKAVMTDEMQVQAPRVAMWLGLTATAEQRATAMEALLDRIEGREGCEVTR